MSYQPQYGGSSPYANAPTPGVPIGQPIQQGGPPQINNTSHPGYGPPPPIPGNRPNSGNQPQPQPQVPYPYGPPSGPPPGQQYPQYYPPPQGPPPGHPQYPQYPQAPQQNPPPQSYSGYPPPSQFPGAPQAYNPPPQDPLWYLGTPIPDPHAHSAQYGAQKVPGYDPGPDFEAVRKATKGFGTNDTLLLTTLAAIPALKMDALAEYFLSKTGKQFVSVLDSETSSWFGMGIHGIATGPLAWDIELVHQAVAGVGTNEALLTELIMGRPNAELRLLKAGYRQKYGRELIDAVRGDLSGKTERMFLMALAASRPLDTMPVNQAEVANDVDALYHAGQGKIGTDEIAFCNIIINRSQPHLTALIGAYANKYKSLTKVIKSEFSGHMRSALLYIVEGAKPKRDGQGIWRDAKLMDKAMVGFGTKDAQLVWRIVRAHWDPRRMEAIKEAYRRRTGKNLDARVASETSGSYKKLMVALVNGTGIAPAKK